MKPHATPKPEVTFTPYGKWLAVSPQDAPIRIGVVADTEDGAHKLFCERYALWHDSIIPQPDYQI